MQLKDSETGELFWSSENWGSDVLTREAVARVPSRILRSTAVSREIEFSSVEMMSAFRLEQRVFIAGILAEEWNFNFGFVIPGSRNTWSSTILAAEPEDMIPAEMLSGNVLIESRFFDGDLLIATSQVRVFYDEEGDRT